MRTCLALVFVLLAAACGQPQKQDPGPTPTPTPGAWPDPSCFTGGTTPQLDVDAPVANWTWNDPHVIKVGSEYWMYASATDNFAFPVRSYRLVSTDAVHWSLNPSTPILADAGPGHWDSGGIETPAVVYFGGQYHLFYTSYPVEVGQPGHSALDYRVGHATSPDGITFTRVADAPFIDASGSDSDPSNDWYQYLTGEPGPVVVGNELFVYFTTVGVDQQVQSSLQVIGVVTSTDGNVFAAPQLALKPDQTIYPRSQDWVGYSTPNAAVVDGKVQLFVDVARQPQGGDWRQLRLHHATSANGLTGWTQDASPILSAPYSDWAVDEVNSPDALLDGSTLRLWFAGHATSGGVPHLGIGMLSCAM